MVLGSLIIIKSFVSPDGQNLSGEKGLIVKGPYEGVLRFSKGIRQITMVFDVLINGKIYKEIPRDRIEKV